LYSPFCSGYLKNNALPNSEHVIPFNQR